MELNQRTATIIMHEGWGKNFNFEMEDNHAYYFKTDEQEAKVVKDYEAQGFFNVEGREHGQEDWMDWDTVYYDEAADMVATANASERQVKKQQELTL